MMTRLKALANSSSTGLFELPKMAAEHKSCSSCTIPDFIDEVFTLKDIK